MAENKLVSVIVPVYNVESYLDECVESLIHQTYNNIEILLIDDGSTDNSGQMCDKYALEYDQVRAFHKENGGLADARNFGLERLSGDYVCFVDSDDYVEKSFVSELIAAVEKYSVDIACVRWKATSEAEQLKIPCTGDTKILDSSTVLKEMVSPIKYGITVSVWDRIYKRDIIKGLSFPKGKCYEDILFSTNAIIRAKKVAYIDKELYNYRVRSGSITRPTQELLDKRLITDKLYLEMEQLKVIENMGLKDVYQYNKLFYYYEILDVYARNPYKEYNSILQEYLGNVRISIFKIILIKVNPRLKTWVVFNILINKARIVFKHTIWKKYDFLLTEQ